MNTCCPPRVLPDARLAAGAARLAARYAAWFGSDTVADLLADSYWRLMATAHVHSHLVILAERLTRERLDALAALRSPPPGPARVLFVCGHNAGRSQIAAGLLARRAQDAVRTHDTVRTQDIVTVSSAGTHPADDVELAVLEVMLEAGIDLAQAFPKPLTEEVVAAADVVITLGCGDVCPLIPGRRYLNWSIADPDGASIDEVRRIRDEIDLLVTDLLYTIHTR